MSFSSRTKYQGHDVNQGTLAILKAANVLLALKEFGGEKEPVTMLQGGYNRGGVAASAGTHDGGGAFDITEYNWKNRVKVFRLLGVALWHRPHNWDNRGGGAHMHGIVCGDGSASAGAEYQVREFYAKRNGLANRAKDADWRPKKLPILFHLCSSSELAPHYVKVKAGMYDGPGTSYKNLGKLAVGAKFTPVAWVKVDGKYWIVNPEGRWFYQPNLTTTKPPTSHKAEDPVLVADDRYWKINQPLWGLTGPNGKNRFHRDAGYVLHTTKYAIVDGVKWRVTTAGTWYAPPTMVEVPKPSSKPPVTPPPVEPKSFTFHMGTLNVIRWRLGTHDLRKGVTSKKGLDYFPDRVKGLAKIRDDMGVSVFTTCESGQYVDADHLSEAMGKDWKNVLHGDAAGDITQAVHWFDTKRKLLKEGSYTTGNGPTLAYHNTATWALLQDIGSEVIFLVVGHHADYRSRGTTSASTYDKNRYNSTKVLISEAEKIAAAAAKEHGIKSVPIVFAGDFNQDKDDFYDGPGKAMTAAGYIDCETVTTGKTGPETTINSLDPKKTTGRRLDRIFVKAGTKVGSMVTVAGYPSTDHNGVGVSVTFTNN